MEEMGMMGVTIWLMGILITIAGLSVAAAFDDIPLKKVWADLFEIVVSGVMWPLLVFVSVWYLLAVILRDLGKKLFKE